MISAHFWPTWNKTTKLSKIIFGHTFHRRLWAVGAAMAARSRDSQRQEASGPMDWPPPVRMSGWILKITFFTGCDFLAFFLYKTVISARFGPKSKKRENCENQFTALTLMSCTWLHRVRRARWPRWGVPTCESGFAAGANKNSFWAGRGFLILFLCKTMVSAHF